jgi:hypothetical protein
VKIFLLSPARCDGRRAQALLNPAADFPLAVQLRQPDGASLGEVFAFLSGLYFRGKLTYARVFASADAPGAIRIITTDRGLVTPETRVRPEDLRAFSRVDLGSAGEEFERPLLRDAEQLDREAPAESTVVLLGSIATNKYVTPLLRVFEDGLLFPREFIGRGDMSRGGLMLRHAQQGTERCRTPGDTGNARRSSAP